jgi:hypothetical protein
MWRLWQSNEIDEKDCGRRINGGVSNRACSRLRLRLWYTLDAPLRIHKDRRVRLLRYTLPAQLQGINTRTLHHFRPEEASHRLLDLMVSHLVRGDINRLLLWERLDKVSHTRCNTLVPVLGIQDHIILSRRIGMVGIDNVVGACVGLEVWWEG